MEMWCALSDFSPDTCVAVFKERLFLPAGAGVGGNPAVK
jgi:hypothetical protein